jgi:hypothetical protein
VDLAHAVRHIGEEYDYGALFGFAWAVMLWRWFRIKAKNPTASAGAVVCSEFVLCLDPEGKNIPEWRGIDPERTHCQHLIQIAEDGPSFERIH